MANLVELFFASWWGMWGIPLCLFSRWTKSPRTLKTELTPPEVIQDLRTVCHESLAEPTHRRIAAQRQPANTRSERAQEMIRQRGKFFVENCCKKESPGSKILWAMPGCSLTSK